MLDTNHKTIFILDHTQYFSIPSENYIDLDCLKTKGSSSYAPPLSKSLWTCSVEGAIEYSRIVWDLFPKGKLVSHKCFGSTSILYLLFLLADTLCCQRHASAHHKHLVQPNPKPTLHSQRDVHRWNTANAQNFWN